MRPYLAIIRDSFHAAFASRILWIVLICIAVLLLALAPIGYQEVFTIEFGRQDINSRSRLTGLLGQGLESEQETPAKRIAKALPAEFQTKINDSIKKDQRGPDSGEFAEAFNPLLDSESWYDAELWGKTQRLRELRELDEQETDDLSEKARQRRARLRIEAALPGAFRASSDKSIQITYGFLETPIELPFTKVFFADFLNQFVYPAVLNFLLGVGAVFVGILVTSPIIPDMFQPGALHLLLSKPVSRPALYLSKFIGGCAFVFLCVMLLVSGLWLISGTRLDIWNIRLFYSVPVFVFLFVVYYSVSALAGLHWQSAVVSVAVTVVFWFMCFFVGTASGIFEELVAEPARATRVTILNDEVLVASRNGSLQRIDEQGTRQQSMIVSMFGNQDGAVEPLRLDDGRIVVRRGGGRGIGDEAKLIIFDPEENWKEIPGVDLPNGTEKLFQAPDGGLLAISSVGVFHSPADKLRLDPETEEKSGGLFGGFQKMLGNVSSGFQPVLPANFSVYSPADFAYIESSGDLVLYSAGRLNRFAYQAETKKWELAKAIELEGDNMLPTKITATEDAIVLARKGEPLKIYGTSDLDFRTEFPFDDTYSVGSLKSAPDGSYARSAFDGQIPSEDRLGLTANREQPAPLPK